jgi:hypothetical protein
MSFEKYKTESGISPGHNRALLLISCHIKRHNQNMRVKTKVAVRL